MNYNSKSNAINHHLYNDIDSDYAHRYSDIDPNLCTSPLTGATDWGSVVEEDEIIEKYGVPIQRGKQLEKDINILDRRVKQIEYGYQTPEYQAYIRKIPRHKRTKYSPRTPDKFGRYSRRSWDSMIRIWRKQLHLFDSEGERASFRMARNLSKNDFSTKPISIETKKMKHSIIHSSESSSISSDDICNQLDKENINSDLS